jgi:hypothetical protein
MDIPDSINLDDLLGKNSTDDTWPQGAFRWFSNFYEAAL